MGKRRFPMRIPKLGPKVAPEAVVLAVLGFLVDRRYEAGDPMAEDLDAALAEELDRVEAMQRALWEDFDWFEELEPEEEGDGSLVEELRLIHEHFLAWEAA